MSLANFCLRTSAIHTDQAPRPEHSDICWSAEGRGGLLGHGPGLNHDGKFGQNMEQLGACESKSIREGLLQEEWPADALSHCRGDGLRAWISSQVAQSVNTGTDKLIHRC